MRVQSSVGHAVHQLDDVAVLDGVGGLLYGQLLPLRPFDDPPVVDVLVAVAGDLLLVGRAPAIGVSVTNTSVMEDFQDAETNSGKQEECTMSLP